VRLIAAEDEEEQEQRQEQGQQKKPALRALVGVARLFPWHGRQKLAAEKL
jgi:hypothetical protein